MDDMTERPKRIWLLHGAGDEGSDAWCDQPSPNLGDNPDSTEYIRAPITPADLATLAEGMGLAVVSRVESDDPENLRHIANWLSDTAPLIAKDGPNGMGPDFCDSVALNLEVIAGTFRAKADNMLAAAPIKPGQEGGGDKRNIAEETKDCYQYGATEPADDQG